MIKAIRISNKEVFMKRIISLLFSAIFVLFMIQPISAADTLTKDEAEHLIYEVDRFYNYISDGIAREQEPESFYELDNVSVVDIKTISYKELLKRAEAIFTLSAAEKMICDTNYLILAGGELHHANVAPQFVPFSLDKSDMDFSFDLDIKVEMQGDAAIITFNYISIEAPYPEFYVVKRTNLRAVLVNGEWRIEGGDYMDKMFEFGSSWGEEWNEICNYFDTSPSTGDGVMLTLSLAVASALVAAVIRRRRFAH